MIALGPQEFGLQLGWCRGSVVVGVSLWSAAPTNSLPIHVVSPCAVMRSLHLWQSLLDRRWHSLQRPHWLSGGQGQVCSSWLPSSRKALALCSGAWGVLVVVVCMWAWGCVVCISMAIVQSWWALPFSGESSWVGFHLPGP